MLIHFEGKKFWTKTINKKNLIPVTMETGDVVYRKSNSGIIEKIDTQHEEYWLPIEKIEFRKTKNGYFISDIEVEATEFERVLKLVIKL